MARTAIFAYGSLVSAPSISQTLGHPPTALTAARLAGWRRRWTLYRSNERSEKTFAGPGGRLPPFVLGLNLERDEERGLAPNGALFEVSEQDLARLDRRELRYERTEVGSEIEASQDFEVVFTYTARPEHHAPTPPPGAVVLRSYLEAVLGAFDRLGPGERELFLATTGEPPVELIDAVLVRDEIPPGNPRDW